MATTEMPVNVFLLPHIAALVNKGAIVTVIANIGERGVSRCHNIGANIISIPIQRKISFYYDIKSLIQIVWVFKKNNFDIIHSIMPKAGVLSMLAGFVVNIPLRLHTFTGQVWATRKGWKRIVLKMFDKLISRLATNILADSPSQRLFLINEGIVSARKVSVLANGSVCGVDLNRFKPNMPVRSLLRENYGIPESATVYLYVGRMNRDKGIAVLANAFYQIASRLEETWLVLVGPDEEEQGPHVRDVCSGYAHRVIIENYTDYPEHFMAMADVFCLPSFREGFGSVIIEAAAVGLPAIGSRIYGLSDAIIDGHTGLLCTPGHVGELVDAMATLALSESLRKDMGQSARDRAIKEFSCEVVTDAMMSYYSRFL